MDITSDMIWEMARTAFGERGASVWMRGQNWIFSGKSPETVIKSPEGRDRLYDLLCKITLKIHVDRISA